MSSSHLFKKELMEGTEPSFPTLRYRWLGMIYLQHPYREYRLLRMYARGKTSSISCQASGASFFPESWWQCSLVYKISIVLLWAPEQWRGEKPEYFRYFAGSREYICNHADDLSSSSFFAPCQNSKIHKDRTAKKQTACCESHSG